MPEDQHLIADKSEEGGSKSTAKRLLSFFAAVRCNQVLRSVLGHLCLFSTLVIYTGLGGLVFRALERPGEVTRVAEAQNFLWDQRLSFIALISNFSGSSSSLNFSSFLSSQLADYEESIYIAAQQGVFQVPREQPDVESAAETAGWGYLHSVFFASTVLTTIGYGNVAPVTFWGRAFCVVFALVGIPLTLTVIADLGKIIASSLGQLGELLKKRVSCIRHLLADDNSKGNAGLGVCIKSMSFLCAIFLLLMYIAAGAALFTVWEDWTFFEGFYFCFITMTTIGFGDLVPREPDYMLICTVYILVGLAMTSTIIELVRRQYAQSWKRMKELTAHLQNLSGPITDALKKIDLSRASSTIDLSVLTELRELKKTLALTQLETKLRFPTRNKKGNEWQKEVEAAMQEIVQLSAPPRKVHTIVIYESSV